ncbi:GNAT family N-acetyltransferase [Actinomyces sp. ICM47]|uniref:GNAT family N-acetyltransferase n=1 Tax=Actinomyces sp. ICM47 TaxID=936548 RepID=UPI0025BCBF41|nr:GNAT family N-acetyltransferase [Actinomyces sp. ICM47]
MTVELITAATPEIHEAMGRLIPQLSRSAAPMSEADVQRFLSQDSVHLFVFRPDEADAQGNRPILGMLSLVAFEIPTGVRAWVEDVVVDEAARGQGAGFALVEAAVEHAKNVGARTVDLTSRPSREAANRLYQRAGFQLRETNVYRVTLKQK